MDKEQSEHLNRLLNKTTEYLKNVEYPAHKRDLVATATKEGAPVSVLNILDQLPDKTYQSHNDLVALFIEPDKVEGDSDAGNVGSRWTGDTDEGFFS